MEFYPLFRNVHVAMIVASGLLFALRGTAALAGMRWPLSWPVRISSYVIDSALLIAAMSLVSMLPWSTFANGWLAMKLGLLVAYVMLGYMALRPGRSSQVRIALFAMALLTYGWMYTIARAHHPLGWFQGFMHS